MRNLEHLWINCLAYDSPDRYELHVPFMLFKGIDNRVHLKPRKIMFTLCKHVI